MPRLNSCPVDNGQCEFHGISRHPTGTRDPETGDPIIDHFRWQQCTTCGTYSKEDFNGKILELSKIEPNRKWFEVPKDA